ncbi:MAG: 3-dehydroquinate synthase [Chlamydiales bacterium 38-26]|nr:3-dehydroquinate synthase [Chlamydiales bacterium]OJV08213.1 MAG: 3-dehydroquinate synthase [Chlamydiales bacterium 38-26]
MLIQLPEVDSNIQITSEPLSQLSFLLKKNYSQAVLISDTSVFSIYGREYLHLLHKLPFLSILPITIPPGETSKNWEIAYDCWNKMHQAHIDKQAIVISLGGGVVSDLTGFIAACYMRGLDVIHIPTTLMGMIDAAIGGKTGINLESGKNIVGIIHQPKCVLIDPNFLETLPQKEFIASLAEVIKYGIILSPELFEFLETNTQNILEKKPNTLRTIIEVCCQLKAKIIKVDEKENNVRAILNFGHTFGHAIEASTQYRQYLHGEAVAIGLSCAFYTSHLLGLIPRDLIHRLHQLLDHLQLPYSLPIDITPETLIQAMYKDKKTSRGVLQLILLKALGEIEVKTRVTSDLVIQALNLKKLHESPHGKS